MSSNRIELSQLVHDLLNFGVLGSLWLWGGARWKGVSGGMLGHGGTPHMCTCMCTHAHACMHMYRNCKCLSCLILKFKNVDLIKIIQFCLKIYDLYRHPHPWVGGWVGQWVNGWGQVK